MALVRFYLFGIKNGKLAIEILRDFGNALAM